MLLLGWNKRRVPALLEQFIADQRTEFRSDVGVVDIEYLTSASENYSQRLGITMADGGRNAVTRSIGAKQTTNP